MCDIAALNNILARESKPLASRARNLRDRERELGEAEATLSKRARDKEHRERVRAFSFAANNKKAIDETHVYDGILYACAIKREKIKSQESKFCDWLGDRPLHLSDLNDGADFFRAYFASYGVEGSEESTLPLDNGICKRMMASAAGYLISLVELEEDLRHAFIASKALGAELPATVLKILNSHEPYFESLKEQLFSDKYAEIITSLQTDRKKSELAQELLKLLYPKKWEEYLAETDETFMEKKKVQEEEKQWKKKFAAAGIFTEFSFGKIRGFMELSGADVEKAVEFAKLADSGLFPADIFMLMKIGADASEREAHASANKFLAINGLCHESIRAAVKSLDDDQRKEFPERARQYACWLRMMPDNIPYDSRQEISAMLAFCAEPPKNPKEVYRALLENDQKILEQNERMRHSVPEQVFSEYRDTMLNVSMGKEKMLQKEFIPPHEEIYFSSDLRWHLGLTKVNPEDVRRMAVYGLRLASQKSTREGRYIAATAFRDSYPVLCAEADTSKMPEEELKAFLERHRLIAENVELLLRREGVIVVKDNRLVRLNINGKEDGNTITPMGKEILRMTETWIEDIYPPPEKEEEERELGAALSEIKITDEEEMASAAELANSTAAFRGAQGRAEKISALEALEKFGEKAVPAFSEGLNDQDAEVRAVSLRCLADASKEKATIISILKLIGDAPFVQEEAARALGRISAKRGIWPLTARLKEGTEQVRIECARSLGKMGAAAAVGELENALVTDESTNVRAEIQIALTRIKGESG